MRAVPSLLPIPLQALGSFDSIPRLWVAALRKVNIPYVIQHQCNSTIVAQFLFDLQLFWKQSSACVWLLQAANNPMLFNVLAVGLVPNFVGDLQAIMKVINLWVVALIAIDNSDASQRSRSPSLSLICPASFSARCNWSSPPNICLDWLSAAVLSALAVLNRNHLLSLPPAQLALFLCFRATNAAARSSSLETISPQFPSPPS